MVRLARAAFGTAYGIQMPTLRVPLWNRTGSAASNGQLVMLDLAKSATEVTSYTIGLSTSAYGNFVDPTTAGASTDRFYMGLVDESGGIGDDESGMVLLHGIKADGLVIRDSGSITAGDLLIADVSNFSLEGMSSLTSGFVHFARALEDVTTPTSNTAAPVEFDGINMPWGVAP